MSPSFDALNGLAGNKFRLNPNVLPPKSRSPRELFMATQAPAPGQPGQVVLTGCLSGETLTIGTAEDVLLEKVD